MAITKETIRSWIDPTKAGIIVVGTPRCGSHFLTDIINTTIADANTEYVGELQMSPSDDATSSEWFMKKGKSPGNFTISSIVCNDERVSAFNFLPNYLLIREHFTTIKLTRPLIDQLMSDLIKRQMFTKHNDKLFHSGMTSVQFSQLIDYPISGIDQVPWFLLNHQSLISIPCDYNVDYTDLLPLGGSAQCHTKNEYGITPREFFNDYDRLSKLFSGMIFH